MSFPSKPNPRSHRGHPPGTHTGVLSRLGAVLLGGVLSAGQAYPAEIIELPAIADTTLIEHSPTNNMGAHPFFNAGSTFIFPLGSSLPTRNRALIRFDLSAIPPGSQVLSAQVHAEMVGEPRTGGAPSLFSLHRMLRQWGEGEKTSTSGSPGLGMPATQGEATWRSPATLTGQLWSTPGGASDIDFIADVSSTYFMEDAPPDDFTFESSEQMIADTQLWIDDPNQNFGWLLRTLSESTAGTARRFASRESPDGPRLVVEFLPPLRFESIHISGAQIELRFQAQAGQSYSVEFTPELPAQEWTTLETIEPLPADQTVLVTDTLEVGLRIYRVVRH